MIESSFSPDEISIPEDHHDRKLVPSKLYHEFDVRFLRNPIHGITIMSIVKSR